MSYKVKLTTNAISHIQAVVNYIADDLLEPQTALRWKENMQKDIAQLSFMPGRVRLTEEEPWHSLGVHKLLARRFCVYFWIDEEAQVVWVTAVVYEKREQLPVLIDMSMEE